MAGSARDFRVNDAMMSARGARRRGTVIVA